MVELVDTGDLKSPEACRLVPVQVRLSPLVIYVVVVVLKKILALIIVSAVMIVLLRLYRSKVGPELHLNHAIAASDVIAVVGGVEIKARDLQFEVDLQLRDAGVEDVPELQQEVLSELLERRILYEHLKRDARVQFSEEKCRRQAEALIMSDPVFYTSAPRQEGIRRKLCEQAAIRRYSEKHVFANISVAEQELEDFFNRNRERYLRPAAVSFRQIVLPQERQAKRIRALVTAENFSSYARQHSIAPEAENGGLLGPLTKNELPQVFHVLFKMRAQRITKVLKSPYGFHIILLLRKHPAGSGSLADFRAEVEQAVRAQKQRAEYRKWLEVAMHSVSFSLPRR